MIFFIYTSDKTGSKSYTTPSSNSLGKPAVSSSNYNSKKQYNEEYSIEKTTSNKSKDKFQSWMEEREKSEKLKLKDNKEPDVLHVSSSRTPGFATPDPEWDSSVDYSSHSNHFSKHDHRADVAKTLMSHQDFDDMANKIVARVKNELDVPNKSHNKMATSYSGYYHGNAIPNISTKDDSKNCNVRATYSREREDLSSHYCPECGQLMVGEYLQFVTLHEQIFSFNWPNGSSYPAIDR